MDVSVQQDPEADADKRISGGIPPLLIIDGPVNECGGEHIFPSSFRSSLGKDHHGFSTSIGQATKDSETTLALYLLALYRLTQIQQFSIPIYIPGAHNNCTVKTLCFIAGETLEQIRARVRMRLEVPGKLLKTNSAQESSVVQSSSFAACLLKGDSHTCTPRYLVKHLSASACQATLIVRDSATCANSDYFWLSQFPKIDHNPHCAVVPYLEKLTELWARNPNQDFYCAALISGEERQLHERFSTDITENVDLQPVVRQFETSVKNHPDAPALSHQGVTVTYYELHNFANLIAKQLQEDNVAAGDYVGVLVSPSIELFASILAIHKVGAVYLPLDPTFPKTRLKKILEVAPPTQILCDSSTELLCKNLELGYKSLDGLLGISRRVKYSPNIAVEVDIDSASHVFFTSGTTGMPKGIIATHRNFAHTIYAGIRRYGFAHHEKFIAIARCTFSISMFEYFTPLVLAASVRLLDRDSISNPAALCRALQSATVVHMVPSLLRQVVEYLRTTEQGTLQSLNYLLTGGDMVPAETLEQAIAQFPNSRIFVNYGSSEISCMGCTYEIDRKLPRIRTKVGKPHPNMKVRILDNNRNEVPTGICGELYFSGTGVVPGYMNRPDLNSQKFINIGGDRFFATGDIGRFDNAGDIELLGREDFQVQINGIRIEPPEIEARLKQLNGIRDCVVVGRNIGASRQASLVAYVVMGTSLIKASEITSWLQEYLPEYMCPSAYVQLQALPTNHNGKIDRSQLPAPSLTNILTTESSGHADNKMEKELIEIWEESFELEGLHPDHDFFEIGGTSLKAISMLANVRARFSREIPLPQFLANRTVRLLAQLINSPDNPKKSENIALLKEGDERLPVLFCLNGSVQYRELATTIDIPNRVAAVTLREEEEIISDGIGSDSFDAISDFRHITEKYFNAITSYQKRGPYYLSGASFGGLIAFEVARRLLQMREKVSLIALYDTWTPGYRDKARLLKRINIGVKKIRESGLDQVKIYGYRAIAKVLRLKQIPPEASASNDIRDILRNTALASYRLSPLNHSLLLFNARDRVRYYGEPDEDHLGWKRYASAVEVCKVPGDHIGILKYPNVTSLARKLEAQFSNQTLGSIDAERTHTEGG